MASASPHVVQVTEENFEAEVVNASMTQPVLIDFWADWCGPCKTLGPELEALADEHGGTWRLAKVDVDRSPQLAAYFQAKSIPTVVAISQGQFVDQFVGALPKAQLKEFVEGVLARAGVEVPAGPREAPKDPAQAEVFWRGELERDPEDQGARYELGRLLLAHGQEEDATALLKQIPAIADEYNAAQAALALGSLLADVAAAGGESLLRDRLTEDPSDQPTAYLVACADGARGRYRQSLAVLVDLVASAPKELRDKAKKAAAVIFDAAGRDDEAIEDLRRRLARLLF